MSFKRKYNSIPPFLWFVICVLNYDTLFIGIMWGLSSFLNIIKNGSIRYPQDSFYHFISDGHYVVLWIALPIIIAISISLLRSAVTEITIRNEVKKITIAYHPAICLFLHQKEMSISFDKLDYYVDYIKWGKIHKILLPFRPTKCIVFYKDNRFLLQFGCTMGWTDSQFEEIVSRLNQITPPSAAPKTY